MTRQEIFDIVAVALLKQGRPSISRAEESTSVVCSYLDEHGNKCAVGHLFNEAEYKAYARLKGGIEDLNEQDVGSCILRPFFLEQEEFLSRIQCAHDGHATKFNDNLGRIVAVDPEHWRAEFIEAMRVIASDYSLNPASLNT